KGLSSAPTLAADDLGAFFSQLKATPIPSGTVLLVWDGEKQLLNTRADDLARPQRRWTDISDGPETLRRLRNSGYSVSNRLPREPNGRNTENRIAVAIR